jgi:hypothetical protein
MVYNFGGILPEMAFLRHHLVMIWLYCFLPILNLVFSPLRRRL